MAKIKITLETIITLETVKTMDNDADRDLRSSVKSYLKIKGKTPKGKVWGHKYPWKAAIMLIMAKYPEGKKWKDLRPEFASLPWSWEDAKGNAAKAHEEKAGIVANVRQFVTQA